MNPDQLADLRATVKVTLESDPRSKLNLSTWDIAWLLRQIDGFESIAGIATNTLDQIRKIETPRLEVTVAEIRNQATMAIETISTISQRIYETNRPASRD